MFPGTQLIRLPIRILPYAASFGVFFILFQHRNTQPKQYSHKSACEWLAFSCFDSSLLKSFSSKAILLSGLAQLGLQLTNLCPVIWTMFAKSLR